MKSVIETKLEEYTKKIIEKPELTEKEIDFLVYMLTRIETKEEEEKFEKQKIETSKMISYMSEMMKGDK